MSSIAMILIGLCLVAAEPEPVPHKAGDMCCVECSVDLAEVTGSVTEITRESLGTFCVTAYCGCSECCGAYAEGRGEVVTGAIGEPLTAGYSIAVDPNVIPLGSTVTINGQEYKAQDTGGAIKGNRIDMYFDDHEDAIQFGVQYMEVER